MQATQAIEAEQLHLDDITPANKVPGSYKQTIRMNGNRIYLQTMNYRTETGIFMFQHTENKFSLRLPLDNWLRRNLGLLQDFVVSHTKIPVDVPRRDGTTYVFKSVIEQDSMMISVSKWCKFYEFDGSKGAYIEVDNFSQFSKGEFSVNIEVSHVYIGPHKGGQHFSLFLRVHQITYKKDAQETDQSELLDELLKVTTVESVRKKKAKNSRKKAKNSDTCLSNTSGAMASEV